MATAQPGASTVPEAGDWPRLILENLADPIYVGDGSGRVIDANRAVMDRLRCTRQEVIGASAFDFVVGFTPDLYLAVKELTGAGKPVIRRELHRRRDGSLYAAEDHVSQIHRGGETLTIVCERTLDGWRGPEVVEQGALDGSWRADAVVAVDAGGLVVTFSDGAQRVFRVAKDAIIGRSFTPLCTAPLMDAVAEHLRQAKGSLVPVSAPAIRTGARRASGEVFPAEAVLRYLETGGQALVAILVRDASQQPSSEAAAGLPPAWSDAEPACLSALVGSSPAMRRLRALIRMAAVSNATVLVLGETGTGKELVATALHALSPRRGGPFVPVNSAALPPGLIESELFGHERGAYTDAVARKIGRFESAHRGSIFLDEIGDLPLDLQAKLLRVLQERRLTRLGGDRTIDLDVRIIAATNRDLRAAVAEGRFRADLFYRLNVLPIVIPPLRERREDIPELVQHFARELGARHDRAKVPFSAGTLALMRAYDWPGNVRELQNLVERAVALSAGGELPIEEWWEGSVPSTAAIDLRQLERERILAALERSGWRVSGVHGCAGLLGLRPSTLLSRMKKLGIRRPRP